jgi:O-antigen/teichoic acid export membrane protein
LITNIIQFIAFRADYWLISIYYDHVSVGVYAQASKFAQLLWIIPGVLAGLIVPALKNKDQKLSDSKFISLCRVLFYVHIALMLLLIVAALIIYSFFLPPIYFDGFLSLLIMTPGYLIFYHNHNTGSLFLSQQDAENKPDRLCTLLYTYDPARCYINPIVEL